MNSLFITLIHLQVGEYCMFHINYVHDANKLARDTTKKEFTKQRARNKPWEKNAYGSNDPAVNYMLM